MSEIIVDYIDNIAFDTNNPPFKNYKAFQNLFSGIHRLATEVREMEINELKKDSSLILHIDFTTKSHLSLLVSYFDWYSISICNFVRLVGLFELMSKNNWTSKDIPDNEPEIKRHCRDYIIKIIPEVYKWRNKISAHLTATDPRGDTLGTIEFSLFSFVTYIKPYYEVGGFQWNDSELKRWSITEEYDKLTKRFWPGHSLKKLE